MKSPKKTPGRKAPRTSARRSGPDAVALLKADHRKVAALFSKAEKAKGGAKEKLVEQICNELIIHTTIEEEIFYPACHSDHVEEDKLDEAQVEHDGAKVLINELKDAGADSPMYDAKVKVLSEYIKHHVKEEEQPRKGLFAEAKRKGVDMASVGAELKARKEALMRDAESGRLPRPEPKSIGGAKPSNGAAEGGLGRLRNIAAAAKRATLG